MITYKREVKPRARHSFFPLFVTNLLGTLNDNFLKTCVVFAAGTWFVQAREKSVFTGLVAGLLVLPFILASPFADRLTFLFSKLKILRLAKVVELPIVSLGIVGFSFDSPVLLVLSVLLMGLQSALYSPAKYALVRDVGGRERLSVGMGGMEGSAFLGMLLGTVGAAGVTDYGSSFWRSAMLLFFAALGLVMSLVVRAEEEPNRELHAISPWRYACRAHRMVRHYPGLGVVLVALSLFWFSAAMLQMGLLVYGENVMQLTPLQTGGLLCGAAIGIVVGQVVAGYVDRSFDLLGLTPLAGLAGAILLALLFWVPMGLLPFAILLGILALILGFFKLPLDAEIPKVVKGARLNTALAYFNQISFTFMLLASAVYALLSWVAGPSFFFLFLAGLLAVTSVALFLGHRRVLCSLGKMLLAWRYAVKVEGPAANQRWREDGEALLVLPNHPAMVDPLLVVAAFGRRELRPLCDEHFLRRGGLSARVLHLLGAIEVPDLRRHRNAAAIHAAQSLAEVVTGSLALGQDVIFYPSGHLWTSPREEIGTRQLAYRVCGTLPAGVRVLGVRTQGLWGSIWSRAHRASSPPFAKTLLKSVCLWFLVAPFIPRRKVSLWVEDLTERVRAWSATSRLEFNRALESWYNAEPCPSRREGVVGAKKAIAGIAQSGKDV